MRGTLTVINPRSFASPCSPSTESSYTLTVSQIKFGASLVSSLSPPSLEHPILTSGLSSEGLARESEYRSRKGGVGFQNK